MGFAACGRAICEEDSEALESPANLPLYISDGQGGGGVLLSATQRAHKIGVAIDGGWAGTSTMVGYLMLGVCAARWCRSKATSRRSVVGASARQRPIWPGGRAQGAAQWSARAYNCVIFSTSQSTVSHCVTKPCHAFY